MCTHIGFGPCWPWTWDVGAGSRLLFCDVLMIMESLVSDLQLRLGAPAFSLSLRALLLRIALRLSLPHASLGFVAIQKPRGGFGTYRFVIHRNAAGWGDWIRAGFPKNPK